MKRAEEPPATGKQLMARIETLLFLAICNVFTPLLHASPAIADLNRINSTVEGMKASDIRKLWGAPSTSRRLYGNEETGPNSIGYSWTYSLSRNKVDKREKTTRAAESIRISFNPSNVVTSIDFPEYRPPDGLTSEELKTLNSYAESSESLTEAAAITARRKLTMMDMVILTDNTFRREISKNRIIFFHAPGQLWEVCFDDSGVVSSNGCNVTK